jgi:YtfJ family uncharacterized protein
MKAFGIWFFLMVVGWGIELGKVPPLVTLEGQTGGYLNGQAWNSQLLKGKVYVIFYVDPDKKDLNNDFSEALKARQFDLKRYHSIAIVNLAATFMPNFLIEAKLKQKQARYPNALYLKDKQKVLVKAWGLEDNNSDILIFDQKGKLIYQKFGKLSQEEIAHVLKMIEKHL